MSPEDIKEAFPELSLAQIFSALAYYYEHKEEFDKQIEEWENYIEILRNQYPKNKIYFKLKEKGLI
jgi:predicted RNase H-like nuclease